MSDGQIKLLVVFALLAAPLVAYFVASAATQSLSRFGSNRAEISERQSDDNTEYFMQRIAQNRCKKVRSDLEILLRESDDVCANIDVFVSATQKLLEQGRCTEMDLRMNRGWVRTPQRGPFHFSIYCNDFNDQVFLDSLTSQIY